jgi:hypothetical protein
MRTLINFENGVSAPRRAVLAALERVLSERGIVWSEDEEWVCVKIRRHILDVTDNQGS